MDLFRQKTAPVREKRLQAISAFSGNTKTLLEEYRSGEVNQRVRTFSQDTYSDILHALGLINTIRDIAVVVHGPAGCAASRLYFDLIYDDTVKWAVTNLNERDSILGSDAKLAKTIRELFHQYHPKAIFVVTTPVVAINNDDVESVVEDLKEELNIPVIPVYADGFRSKIGYTGFDVVIHSLIKHAFPKKISGLQEGVTLITINESAQDLWEIKNLVAGLDLTPTFFPAFAALDDISQVAKNCLSISVSPDDGFYLGELLREKYGSAYLPSVLPVGIKNTTRWLTDIGQATGKSQFASTIITIETNQIQAFIDKNTLGGQKTFINLPPSYAFALLHLAEETHLEVTGIKLPYIDNSHVEELEKINKEYPDLPIFVGEGQVFEEVNFLARTRPDLYIGNRNDFSAASNLGIPFLNIQNIQIVGYSGVRNFIEAAKKKLQNPSFVKHLSGSGFYSENWLQKKPNWFIKQEVK